MDGVAERGVSVRSATHPSFVPVFEQALVPARDTLRDAVAAGREEGACGSEVHVLIRSHDGRGGKRGAENPGDQEPLIHLIPRSSLICFHAALICFIRFVANSRISGDMASSLSG